MEPTPKLGMMVGFNIGNPIEGGPLISRAAVIVQVIDNDTVALSVYAPSGLQFINSVTRGDELNQWNYIPD